MKHVLIILITLSNFCSIASNKKSFLADTTKVTEANVLYKTVRDDNYMYLNISTTDKKTAIAIIKNGLTVYYDIQGKQKKDIYVKYPYTSNTTKPQQISNLSKYADETSTVDLKASIEQLSKEGEYAYFDAIEQFHKDLNTLDITLTYKYITSKQLLEFSIRIPIDKITSKKHTDLSKLKIGVFTNTIEKRLDKGAQQSQNQGMKSGGGRRGNGMGQGAKSRENGQKPNTTTKKVSIDYWFNTNLDKN
ncbi:hypothetical protein [Yeosuana marina]|uniref:hypothetical protein n=1 Tax=Yeosuana marina TaxID=1565536 RepID=UPI0030C8B720